MAKENLTPEQRAKVEKALNLTNISPATVIYALRIHSFAYLATILIILATIGLNRVASGASAGWIIALLWITFAVQIFLSIRVYRQGWFISIFKFFFGGFVYLIVLAAALAATFFITLAMP